MSPTDPGALGDFPDPIDFRQIAATDTLIDQIARRNPPAGDQLAADLAGLLDLLDTELDDLGQSPASAWATSALVAHPTRNTASTWARGGPGRRRLVVAAAVSALAMGGTGVAAATPGSFLYPAHRVIFGGTSSDQPFLAEATQALDQAQTIIATGQLQHGLSKGDQDNARVLLERAHGLITTAPTSVKTSALLVRWQKLTAVLSGLPVTPSPPAGHSKPPPPAVASPTPRVSTGSGGGDHNSQGEDTTDKGNGSTDSGSTNGPSSDGTDSGNPTTKPSSTSGNGGGGGDGGGGDGGGGDNGSGG